MAFESSIMSARTMAPSDGESFSLLPIFGQEGFEIDHDFPEPLSARWIPAHLSYWMRDVMLG